MELAGVSNGFVQFVSNEALFCYFKNYYGIVYKFNKML